MATLLQAPAEDFVESLGNETVVLIVGKKRKEFTVHKQLLCKSCDYFRRAFDGSFKEGQEGKMYLEEESAGAVAIFVEWLYRSRIRPTTHLWYLHDLFKLYVMAEKICLDELADRVIDAIIRSFYGKHEYYFHLTLEMSSYLWGKTRKGSPMRKFIVETIGHDYYAEIGCKTRDPKNSKNDLKFLWPICKKHKDFFVMFLANFRECMIRDSNGEWILDQTRYSPSESCCDSAEEFCQFHCHEEGYKCAAITEEIRYQDEEDWNPRVKSDFFHDLPPEARNQFGVEVEAELWDEG